MYYFSVTFTVSERGATPLVTLEVNWIPVTLRESGVCLRPYSVPILGSDLKVVWLWVGVD